MGRALLREALGVLGHVQLPLSGQALSRVKQRQGLRKEKVAMQLSTDALLNEEKHWGWSFTPGLVEALDAVVPTDDQAPYVPVVGRHAVDVVAAALVVVKLPTDYYLLVTEAGLGWT